MELQANYAKIRRQGLGLAAISYDSPAILKDFGERKKITFPLLSDAGSATIRAYGLLNTSVEKGSAFDGIPYPGTFILTPQGAVRSKFFEQDYRQRYTTSTILSRDAVALSGPSQKTETSHLTIETTAGDAEVHCCQRITLAVDVALEPKMHVYAPGAKGYIPVSWTIPESPAYTIHDAVYPRSETLYLKVIKEKIAVYRNHFRVTRELTLGTDNVVKPLLSPDGNLTLQASFRYQACDDHECYLPKTVPLNWTLHYSDLDRQRSPEAIQHRPQPKQ